MNAAKRARKKRNRRRRLQREAVLAHVARYDFLLFAFDHPAWPGLPHLCNSCRRPVWGPRWVCAAHYRRRHPAAQGEWEAALATEGL